MIHHPVGWGHEYDEPIVSIRTDSSDKKFWYSPDFSKCGPSIFKRSVTITMTGNRAKDFKKCNGNQSTPAGCTWHHKYMTPMIGNECEMQLVDKTAHRKSCSHLGGFGQYESLETNENANKIRAQFRMSEADQDELRQHAERRALANNALAAAPLQASEVNQLAKQLSISLPPVLVDFYRDGHQVTPKAAFLTAADCTYLIDSVYPFVRHEAISENLQAILEDEKQRVGGAMLYARDGAIPVADDPFGNIYFIPAGTQNVYFYDHETDTAFDTHISVDQFMNQLFA